MPARLIALMLIVVSARASAAEYAWERLTPAAPYPASYNYPVHVAADGRFVALHQQGTWSSRDGRAWVRTALPFSGTNAAYLSYVQHAGATWALGKLSGNYQGFSIDSIVQRTDDYRAWKAIGRSPTLPKVVFYAAASFRGARTDGEALFVTGGKYSTERDGKTTFVYSNDVWRMRRLVKH